MKKTIIIILFIALVLGAYVLFQGGIKDEAPVGSTSTQNRMMPIENYVRIYISELSPIEESLGGRFYVTDIKINGGKGTVWYEDGHSAYIADFEYITESTGEVKVRSFVIRK
jgi:hypothetical protein